MEITMKQITTATRFAILAACLFMMVSITGCSKVDKEHYDKIKIGMSYQEVTQILGNPDSCGDPVLKTKSCTWGSPDKQIKIKFAGDAVAWRSSKGI